MKSWRKRMAWITGAAALALLALMFALPLFFNEERITRLVQEKAEQTWGRELIIGALSLRFRPFPEVHAKNISLANPEWARTKNMLHASSVTAHLELLSLLRRTIRISSLSIDGLRVHLEAKPDGTTNWLIRRDGNGQAPDSNKSSAPAWSTLNAVRFRDADIHYHDKGVQKTWHVDEASAEALAGLRDVRINARLSRHQHPVRLEMRLDDLSRIGAKGATSAGSIDVRWDTSHLILTGKIPLERNLLGHDVQVSLKSESLADVFNFFGVQGQRTAPLSASAHLSEVQGSIMASQVMVALGEQQVSGEGSLSISGARPTVKARIGADRIDWGRLLQDAGRPASPAKPPGELFDTHPLAWKAIARLQKLDGSIDAQIAYLKLRSGVELKNVKAHLNLSPERVHMAPFSANLLGGAISGNVALSGTRKSVRAHLDATDVVLARWFSERGRKVGFTGGPMRIKASVSASGPSMKDLAQSLTGPVSISMGPGVIISQKAGEAETLLTGMFAGSEADRINLHCVGAHLPFRAGRAVADPIVGARSDTSQLLSSGYVDLREQALDLRGRVKAASGVNFGVSTVAGNIRIAGRISRPDFGLDPTGAPEALARLGAAIASGGISILGTMIWDAANAKGDPCAIAQAAGKPSKTKKSAR